MINDKKTRRFKRLLYALIVLFVLFFLVGFLDMGGKPLLAIVLVYFVLGVTLNALIFKSKTKSKLKVFLILTGVTSVVFSFGVSYGIIGIWGFYAINDLVYLSSVIVSFIGFLIGAIGCIVLLKNGGGHDVSFTTD